MVYGPEMLAMSFLVRSLRLSSLGCSHWTGDHLVITQDVGFTVSPCILIH